MIKKDNIIFKNLYKKIKNFNKKDISNIIFDLYYNFSFFDDNDSKYNFIKLISNHLDFCHDTSSFFTLDNKIIIPDFFSINIIILFSVVENTIEIKKYDFNVSINDFVYLTNIIKKHTHNSQYLLKKSKKKKKSSKILSKKKKINLTEIADLFPEKSSKVDNHNNNNINYVDSILSILDTITDNKEYLNAVKIKYKSKFNNDKLPYSKNNYITDKYNLLMIIFEVLNSKYRSYYENIDCFKKHNIFFINKPDFFNLIKNINFQIRIDNNNIHFIIEDNGYMILNNNNFQKYLERKSKYMNTSYKCWAAIHPYGDACDKKGYYGWDSSFCFEHFFLCESSYWLNKKYSDPYHDSNSCGSVKTIDFNIIKKKFNVKPININSHEWLYNIFINIYNISKNKKNISGIINFYNKGLNIIYNFLKNNYQRNAYILNIENIIKKFIIFYFNINSINSWFDSNDFNYFIDNDFSEISKNFYELSIIKIQQNDRYQPRFIKFSNQYFYNNKLINFKNCISCLEYSKNIDKNKYNILQKDIDYLIKCSNDRLLYSNLCYRKKNRYLYEIVTRSNISDLSHIRIVISILYTIYFLIILTKIFVSDTNFNELNNIWEDLLTYNIKPYLINKV